MLIIFFSTSVRALIDKSFIRRVTGVDRVELARGRQLGRTTLMARRLNVYQNLYRAEAHELENDIVTYVA